MVLPLAGPAYAGEQPPPVGLVAVDVSGGALPEVTASAMKREAERIWSAAGIRLEWNAGVAAGVKNAIAVDLIAADVPPHTDEAAYVMGDAIPSLGTVSVSVAAAWRTVRQRARDAAVPVNSDRLALGYVLGRVLAHEIGHQLLGPSHTHRGLMQSRFRTSELLDLRAGLFELMAADTARLAERVGAGELAGLVRVASMKRAAK
jgi:hypothetical protein